jgi:uncharacterized protein YdeI (YjbR/CyaY-like superfamily)
MSAVEPMPRCRATDREAWREWLRKNHARESCVWLVYYKKHTGKPSIEYAESVEEALCFGWIDGLKRRVDDACYVYRFTPRKPGSKWSPLNIRRAQKMIEQGLMTGAGRKAYDQRIEYDEKTRKSMAAAELKLTPEIEHKLKANRKAWERYLALTPSCRKQYAGWLLAAKRPETLAKRIREAKQLLAAGKKLGMK